MYSHFLISKIIITRRRLKKGTSLTNLKPLDIMEETCKLSQLQIHNAHIFLRFMFSYFFYVFGPLGWTKIK